MRPNAAAAAGTPAGKRRAAAYSASAYPIVLFSHRRAVIRSLMQLSHGALAVNAALWALLWHHPSLAFLVHPQLWLVPVALSVLAAAQLNRDRLSAAQLRLVRYVCLMVLYVSSTADIFLNGVRQAPWLPLVLATFSVAGVMLGILLRLRAFLFLGSTFLTVAILTMIYHASADLGWTWLWYVAGIALGTIMIVTFALFEKKRAEMVALVEGLKQWK